MNGFLGIGKKRREFAQSVKARIGINLGRNPRNKFPSSLFHWEHDIALILYMIFRPRVGATKTEGTNN
jgi:hypothetical protein